MNEKAVIVQLADLIVDITDPKITRWRREQIEKVARVKARSYLKKLEEENK